MAKPKKPKPDAPPEAAVVNVAPPEAPVAPPTPKTKAELKRLEAIFQTGHRGAIEALRTIRQDDLYKLAEPPYETFDDYVEQRWGRTRQ